MNQVTTQFDTNVPARSAHSARSARTPASLVAERVRDFACTLAGTEAARELWVRAAGRHVIVGRGDDEAFARITPLGADAYGLAFRAPADVPDESSDADATSPSRYARWAPLLLVDSLADVVEHALIGEGAIDQPALCM